MAMMTMQTPEWHCLSVWTIQMNFTTVTVETFSSVWMGTLFYIILHCWVRVFPLMCFLCIPFNFICQLFKQSRAVSGLKDPHALCVTLITSLKNKTDIQFR